LLGLKVKSSEFGRRLIGAGRLRGLLTSSSNFVLGEALILIGVNEFKDSGFTSELRECDLIILIRVKTLNHFPSRNRELCEKEGNEERSCHEFN